MEHVPGRPYLLTDHFVYLHRPPPLCEYRMNIAPIMDMRKQFPYFVLMQAEAPRTSLSIDGATYRQLVEAARRNERSASAEARVAIRRHLETDPAAQAAETGSAEPAPPGVVGGAA